MTNTQLTSENKTSLKRLAGWTKFLAILGFIGAGLTILIGLFTLLSFLVSGGFSFPEMIVIVTVAIFYIVIAVVQYFLSKKLWDASKTTAILLESKDNHTAASMLSVLDNFSKYFRLAGILTVAGIILSLVFSVSAGIFLATTFQNIDENILDGDYLTENIQDSYENDTLKDINDSIEDLELPESIDDTQLPN